MTQSCFALWQICQTLQGQNALKVQGMFVNTLGFEQLGKGGRLEDNEGEGNYISNSGWPEAGQLAPT